MVGNSKPKTDTVATSGTPVAYVRTPNEDAEVVPRGTSNYQPQ